MEAKFILSKKIVNEKVNDLKELGLKVSYSYKTNREVGDIIQEEFDDVDLSIHAKEELDMVKNKSKIWFFTQAELEERLEEILDKGIRNFVLDNEIDLDRLLKAINRKGVKVNIGLRMKFKEHRIGSGKYYVYGMGSKRVNELVERLNDEGNVDKIGVHIHRKSQNTSEWNIEEEIVDSLTEKSLDIISFLNIGGGLPAKYRSAELKVMPYVFDKLKKAKEFLEKLDIETIIEPGRYIAAPCIKLETEIMQVQGKNVIVNTTLYNCALDTLIGEHKMLIEGELDENGEGEYYLIKGNSPTRDDIFRYKVKLKSVKVGDKIIFLNAGAYNYTTDFFGYKKLKTEVVE